MKYRINGIINHVTIVKWIKALNDPLVHAVSMSFPDDGKTVWVHSIEASGTGETMLLLKYGHVLYAI